MITTAIINLAYYVVNMLLSILPNGTGLPTEMHTAVTVLGGYVGVTDALLPVTTLATCVSIVVTIELVIFGYKTVKSLLTHVPFVGGRG